VFRSALLILSGNAATAVLLLIRNLLVARLIPVADYGVAATFAMTMAIVEMMSTFGLQQQIIQARDGADPRFQAAVQGFQVLRGVMATVVLVLIAHPVAAFLGIPEVAWAYQVLAIAPLLHSLMHFDTHRFKRQMRFLPGVLTTLSSSGTAVLIVWPLAMLFDDWRVMLYSILLQATVGTLVSHLVAERPYRLVFDRAIMQRNLRFGWPLLLNGMLLYFVFHGEKLLVGRELGMEALAIFAMGITLTLAPTLPAAKSAQNFFLPQLSAVARPDQIPSADFRHLAMATVQSGVLIGGLLIVAIALAGGPLILSVLGEKYQSLIPLLGLLAGLSAIRIYKAGTSIVALSCAHTVNALISNIFRVSGLPIAWFVLIRGGTLEAVIWISITAEGMGLLASLFLLRRRVFLPLRPLVPTFATAGLLLGAALVPNIFPQALSEGQSLFLVLACFTVMLASMSDLRRYVLRRRLTRFED
jgi:O-antigen/teichoic acid export membrane protein